MGRLGETKQLHIILFREYGISFGEKGPMTGLKNNEFGVQVNKLPAPAPENVAEIQNRLKEAGSVAAALEGVGFLVSADEKGVHFYRSTFPRWYWPWKPEKEHIAQLKPDANAITWTLRYTDDAWQQACIDDVERALGAKPALELVLPNDLITSLSASEKSNPPCSPTHGLWADLRNMLSRRNSRLAAAVSELAAVKTASHDLRDDERYFAVVDALKGNKEHWNVRLFIDPDRDIPYVMCALEKHPNNDGFKFRAAEWLGKRAGADLIQLIPALTELTRSEDGDTAYAALAVLARLHQRQLFEGYKAVGPIASALNLASLPQLAELLPCDPRVVEALLSEVRAANPNLRNVVEWFQTSSNLPDWQPGWSDRLGEKVMPQFEAILEKDGEVALLIYQSVAGIGSWRNVEFLDQEVKRTSAQCQKLIDKLKNDRWNNNLRQLLQHANERRQTLDSCRWEWSRRSRANEIARDGGLGFYAAALRTPEQIFADRKKIFIALALEGKPIIELLDAIDAHGWFHSQPRPPAYVYIRSTDNVRALCSDESIKYHDECSVREAAYKIINQLEPLA